MSDNACHESSVYELDFYRGILVFTIFGKEPMNTIKSIQFLQALLIPVFTLGYATIAMAQVPFSIAVVDAGTDRVIKPLVFGETLNLSQLPKQISLIAEPSVAVSAVQFALNGPTSSSRTERVSPYALAGDSSGDYAAASFADGNYTLTLTPFDNNGVAGTPYNFSFSVTTNYSEPTPEPTPEIVPSPSPSLTTLSSSTFSINSWLRIPSISFPSRGSPYLTPFLPSCSWRILPPFFFWSVPQFFFPTPSPSVTTLSLVNASTNAPIGELMDGQVLDLIALPGQLNIVAESSATVSKVSFVLSGAKSIVRTEAYAPYALAGDTSGNFHDAQLVAGEYTLDVTSFDSSGSVLETVSIAFSATGTGGSYASDPVSPNDPVLSTFGKFDVNKDFLSLHYDHAPDKDDGHATVAGKMLVDYFGIQNYIAVGGACGINCPSYNFDSEAVMDATWGDGWYNAHANPDTQGSDIGFYWLNTIVQGGKVYVAEGGESDLSLKAAQYVKANGGDPKQIIIIQHSNWNIDHYGTGVLQSLLDLGVTHVKIDDGNSSNDTADLYEDNNAIATAFANRALASQWSTAWEAAFKYLDPIDKLDFSDTVEVLHILGVPMSKVSNVSEFADEFIGVP